MSLDLSRPLGISRHADFKSRANGDVLVLPEQAIRVGGSGAEILRLVAEGRTASSVLRAMGTRYPDSPEIEPEVLSFLERMFSLGGIVWLEDPLEKTR